MMVQKCEYIECVGCCIHVPVLGLVANDPKFGRDVIP